MSRLRQWLCRLLICSTLAFPGVAFALDPGKSIRQFNVQNWIRQTGLPSDKISDIAQSAEGYLWFGTQNGLVRFDGGEFKVEAIALAAAGGQDVKEIGVGTDGGLWFAIYRGGYGHFDGRRFVPIDDPNWQDPNIAAETMLVGRDGAVWTGTVNGLSRWVQNDSSRTFFAANVQPTGTVLALHEDAAGRIWVGTGGNGLYFHDGRVLHEVPEATLRGYSVGAIASDAAGNVWLGTARGLRRYSPERGVVEIILPDTTVTALHCDPHGVLWFGTAGRGLGRYRHGELSFLGKADGLVSDHVLALLQDREGSLWVGTQEGLSQVTDLKFPLYSATEGILAGSVIAVSAAPAGGLWIATASGASFFDGTTARNFNDESLLPNRYTRSVFQARNGDVYIGDGDRNINVIRDGKLVHRLKTELWVDAIAEDDEGVLLGVGWVLHRVRDGVLEPFRLAPGQAPLRGWINRLHVSRNGEIWLATNEGVARIRDGVVRRWGTAEGLSSERVHFVAQDGDGAIWAGLPTGLARIKEEQVRNLHLEDGLPDQRIFAIVPDDFGDFWIASGRGVFRVSRAALNAVADGTARELDAVLFGGLDAVKFTDRTDQGFSGCRTSDGRIWFPNPLGVMMIDPKNHFRNTVPPPVLVEQVRVNGIERGRTGPLELQPNENRVEFTFSVLSYVAPRKIRARYRLEGLDEDWIEAGSRRAALYSRLAPGSYTFRVQASNADGVWNEQGDQLSLRLLPPFHETGWFYALCAVGGVMAIVGGHRWRVRHMKSLQLKLQVERDLLEAKVAERTVELAHEHALLKTLLDSSPDQIYFKDTQSRYLKASQARAENFGLSSVEALLGKSDAELMPAGEVKSALADEQAILRTGQPLIGKIEREVTPDGRERWLLTSKMPLRDKAHEIIGTFGISKDITMLKEAEAKLIVAHRQLLVTSRQAGMAEVATSVLHNVGNVLNSVNVSASLVSDRVRESKVEHLGKATALLDAHADDLAGFLTHDAKGRKLPEFLSLLSGQLNAEREELMREIDHLRKNIDHIKEVVAMQQSYAKVAGVAEAVPLTDLADDALRIYESELTRHQIELVREYAARPVITTERHKVMQVLVNLIQNAKHACADSGRPDKRITVRLSQQDGHVLIAVVDNGVGIPVESLSRIFAHGFTTRNKGHGFGLHSGALTAKELGGSLTAESEGAGQGATFTLKLPLELQPAAAPLPPAEQ